MAEKERIVANVPNQAAVTEKKLGDEVTDIELQASALVIANDDAFRQAGEFGRALKQKAHEVTQFFKPMKDDAYRAHKTICDREKAMLAPLRNAEQMVKKAMNIYTEAQERKRREEEEALRKAAQAEADRKLAEAAAPGPAKRTCTMPAAPWLMAKSAWPAVPAPISAPTMPPT